MKQSLLCLVFTFSFGWIGHAQVEFTSGIDVGITAGQAPFYKKYNNTNSLGTRYYYPLLGPIVGYQLETAIVKHFTINTSLQYSIVGMRERNNSTGFYNHEDLGQVNYRYKTLKKQTFHRISAPITLGFRYRLGENIQQTLAIGYKFNFFIAGKYLYHQEFDSDEDERDYDFDYTFKATDSDNARPIKRFNNQIIFRYTTTIKERFMIGADFNMGQSLWYSEYAYWESAPGNYRNWDLALTFTYRLKK